MKEHGIHLLEYDHWATMKLLTHIESFEEDIFHTQMNSVFSTIAETFYHIFRGQRIWIKRYVPSLEVDESIVQFQDIEHAKKSFLYLHKVMITCIHTYYDQVSEMVYQNSKGTEFKNTIDEIMIHLANHGTYHRGNIASMIREYGKRGHQQIIFNIYEIINIKYNHSGEWINI